eukprot:s161_g12.t2
MSAADFASVAEGKPWQVVLCEDAIHALKNLPAADQRRAFEVISSLAEGFHAKLKKKLVSLRDKTLGLRAAALPDDRGFLAWKPEIIFHPQASLYREVVEVWFFAKSMEEATEKGETVLEEWRTSNRKFDKLREQMKKLGRDQKAQDGDGRVLPRHFEAKEIEDSDLFTLRKFYGMTCHLGRYICRGDALTVSDGFSFVLSRKEADIIAAEGPVLLVGRSGSGKTLCCLERMWQRHVAYWSQAEQHDGSLDCNGEGSSHLNQVFVTLSPTLAKQVQEQFACHVEASNLSHGWKTWGGPAPTIVAEQGLADDFSRIGQSFPLFLTFKKLIRLLDSAVGGDTFFTRLASGEIDGKTVAFAGDAGRVNVATGRRGKTPSKFGCRQEVDFDFFRVHLWREMKGTDQLAPAVVWREIQTFIKGHRKVADSSEGFLSQEDYLELVGMKMNWAVRGCRDRLYNLFLEYERTKKAINGFDRMDVAFDVLRRLQQHGYKGPRIHHLYVDEVQDLAQIEAVLMMRMVANPQAIVFVGDTCQTVSSETDFRFKDLRSCVKEIFYPTSSPEVVKDLWSLLVNYRSHDGIASNRVVSLLEELFPMTIDKLPPAMGQSDGPAPECLNFDELSRLLCELDSSRSSASKCLLGANQLVIVRSEDQKHQFLKVAAACTSGRDAGIVMTAENLGTMMDEIAAKGLEFTDVLMYNFIKDSAYGHWTQLLQSHTNFSKEGSANAEKAIACLELKRLYVAVTRAKKRLLIYEDDAAVKVVHLIFGNSVGKVLTEETLSEVAMRSREQQSVEAWNRRAADLFNVQQYLQARMCYLRAGKDTEVKKCEAHLQRQKAEEYEGSEDKRAELWRDAGLRFRDCTEWDTAAACFRHAGDFGTAAELFLHLNKVEEAANSYVDGGHWEDAAKLFLDDRLKHFEWASLCVVVAMKVPSPMPALRALEYLETHDDWCGYRSLCRLLHREEGDEQQRGSNRRNPSSQLQTLIDTITDKALGSQRATLMEKVALSWQYIHCYLQRGDLLWAAARATSADDLARRRLRKASSAFLECRAFYQAGDCSEEAGDYAEAAATLGNVEVPNEEVLSRRCRLYDMALQRQGQDEIQPASQSQEAAGDASQILEHLAQARRHGGLDSEWTSRLAEAIAAMGGMHARVNSILKSHGWMGNQFSGPPRMDDLMEDLESCCEADGFDPGHADQRVQVPLEEAAKCYKELGKLRGDAGQPCLRQAADLFRRAVRHGPAAELYEQIGDLTSAIECLAFLAQLDTTHSRKAGQLCLQDGQTRRAAVFFDDRDETAKQAADIWEKLADYERMVVSLSRAKDDSGTHKRRALEVCRTLDPSATIGTVVRCLEGLGRHAEAGEKLIDISWKEGADDIFSRAWNLAKEERRTDLRRSFFQRHYQKHKVNGHPGCEDLVNEDLLFELATLWANAAKDDSMRQKAASLFSIIGEHATAADVVGRTTNLGRQERSVADHFTIPKEVADWISLYRDGADEESAAWAVKAAHDILCEPDAKLPEGSVGLLLGACKACLDNLLQFEFSDFRLARRSDSETTAPLSGAFLLWCVHDVPTLALPRIHGLPLKCAPECVLIPAVFAEKHKHKLGSISSDYAQLRNVQNRKLQSFLADSMRQILFQTLENLESKCPFRQKVQVAQLLHSAGNLEQLNVHLLRAYHQDLSSKSTAGLLKAVKAVEDTGFKELAPCFQKIALERCQEHGWHHFFRLLWISDCCCGKNVRETDKWWNRWKKHSNEQAHLFKVLYDAVEDEKLTAQVLMREALSEQLVEFWKERKRFVRAAAVLSMSRGHRETVKAADVIDLLQSSDKEEVKSIDLAAYIKEQRMSEAHWDSSENDPESMLAAASRLLQQSPRNDTLEKKIAGRIKELDLGGKEAVSVLRCCHLCAALERQTAGRVGNIALCREVMSKLTEVAKRSQKGSEAYSRKCYEAIFPARLHSWYLSLFFRGTFYSKSWSDSLAANSLDEFREFPFVSMVNTCELLKTVLVEDFWQMHWHSYPAILPEDASKAASEIIEWARPAHDFAELNDEARKMKAEVCHHVYKALPGLQPSQLLKTFPTLQNIKASFAHVADVKVFNEVEALSIAIADEQLPVLMQLMRDYIRLLVLAGELQRVPWQLQNWNSLLKMLQVHARTICQEALRDDRAVEFILQEGQSKSRSPACGRRFLKELCDFYVESGDSRKALAVLGRTGWDSDTGHEDSLANFFDLLQGQGKKFWDECDTCLRRADKTMLSEFQQRCREWIAKFTKEWASTWPTEYTLRMVLRLHCVAYYSGTIPLTFHHVLRGPDSYFRGHSDDFREVAGAPFWKYLAELVGDDVSIVAREILGSRGAQWRPHLRDLVAAHVREGPDVALPLLEGLGEAWKKHLPSDSTRDKDAEEEEKKQRLDLAEEYITDLSTYLGAGGGRTDLVFQVAGLLAARKWDWDQRHEDILLKFFQLWQGGRQTSFWEGCDRFLDGDKTIVSKFRERCREQLEEGLKPWGKSKAGPGRGRLRLVLRLHCVVRDSAGSIADSFRSLLADRHFHSLLTDPRARGRSDRLFQCIQGNPLWQYLAELFGNDVEIVAVEVLGKGGAEWRPHLQDLVDQRVARNPRVALPLLDALGRAWELQLCSDTDMDSEELIQTFLKYLSKYLDAGGSERELSEVMKATPKVQADPRTKEELQRARAQHKAPRPGPGSSLSDSRDINLGVPKIRGSFKGIL